MRKRSDLNIVPHDVLFQRAFPKLATMTEFNGRTFLVRQGQKLPTKPHARVSSWARSIKSKP